MTKRFWSVGLKAAVGAIFFIGAVCLSNCHAQDMVRVTIKTTLGDIVVDLDHEKAPITVDNFLAYVDSDFYDGTIFHRVISGFVAQGGGFDANLNFRTTQDPIKNEAGNGLSNLTYTIAMARSDDADSATSQFYFNLADNLFLDKSDISYGYAVFGKVVEGQSVVDAIGAVVTNTENLPVETIVINDIYRVTDDNTGDNDTPADDDDDEL